MTTSKQKRTVNASVQYFYDDGKQGNSYETKSQPFNGAMLVLPTIPVSVQAPVEITATLHFGGVAKLRYLTEADLLAIEQGAAKARFNLAERKATRAEFQQERHDKYVLAEMVAMEKRILG